MDKTNPILQERQRLLKKRLEAVRQALYSTHFGKATAEEAMVILLSLAYEVADDTNTTDAQLSEIISKSYKQHREHKATHKRGNDDRH